MNLNIEIVETGRIIDLYLNDEDIISITYYDNCNRGNDSTPEVTFKELFHLIEDNKKAKSLSNELSEVLIEIKGLRDNNKSLRNELDVLKSAIIFNVGYRDIKSGYESYIHYKTFQKHWIPKI